VGISGGETGIAVAATVRASGVAVHGIVGKARFVQKGTALDLADPDGTRRRFTAAFFHGHIHFIFFIVIMVK
jgi:hypothetical protein